MRVNKKKIVSIFKKHVNSPLTLFLFGSFATAQENKDSDVDIAVLFSEIPSIQVLQSLKLKLAYALKKDIDLVIMNEADDVTNAQIIENSQSIYDDQPQISAQFEQVAMSKYAQLNFERKEILQDIAKRGSIHGR